MGEACSIVLRGATEQIIGEAQRSLHDALCVLTSTVKETKTTFGGGKEYIEYYNDDNDNKEPELLKMYDASLFAVSYGVVIKLFWTIFCVYATSGADDMAFPCHICVVYVARQTDGLTKVHVSHCYTCVLLCSNHPHIFLNCYWHVLH